ncbi:MAG: hypothetical protein KGL39_01590 [Patescibacteria group bacterium]|nr:hypothetical protein [Patescibacteria group bacterium]
MPGTVTGGAKHKKHKKRHHKKRGGAEGKTLEQVKKEARRLGVTMSKDGHAKTKAQLMRAVAAKR